MEKTKIRILPTTPIFTPDDFVWYVKKESSILGFTKELADYCNKKIQEAEITTDYY